MCAKGRYDRALVHRKNRHGAQSGHSRAATWRNLHGVCPVVFGKGQRARKEGNNAAGGAGFGTPGALVAKRGVIFWEGGRNWSFQI